MTRALGWKPKTKAHHRGNAGLRHNTVQNMLMDILEEHKPHTKRPNIKREHEVDSKLDYDKEWVIDVADLSNMVYYEVESDRSKTASTKAKQMALAKHNQIDLVIIPLWEIDWDTWSLGDIERWLRGLVH